MKLYLRFPIERRGTLAFDLDGTLYDNPEYLKAQEESQVAELAKFLGVTFDKANFEIETIRKKRIESGLPPTSLGNIFRALGARDAQIVQWRTKNIHPTEWLSEDARLQKALSALYSTFSFALITNNPQSVAEESLMALGVRHL
jgi:FMN phosphatase YigB (HAD superfamily)